MVCLITIHTNCSHLSPALSELLPILLKYLIFTVSSRSMPIGANEMSGEGLTVLTALQTSRPVSFAKSPHIPPEILEGDF